MSQLTSLIDKAASMAGSEYKLAQQLAMQQPTISAWKSGRRRCSATDRAALAGIAGEDAAAEAVEALIDGLADDQSPKAVQARVALQRALKRLRQLYLSTISAVRPMGSWASPFDALPRAA